ncbi:MAG TPA: type IV pilus assembly protein PilM [Patescibacteria group bacterium]|nr:type IV pilus assembly protein PilM [Patescibacteria group bacterium]
MFDFLSKSKSIVGIDIGTSDIKLVQVTHDKQITLDTYGIVNLPYDLGAKFTEQSIIQTAGILKELTLKARITAKKCVISLPNSTVFTSVIEMPKLSESELSSAMEFEAKKYVPLPTSEINLSWTVVSESQVTGNYQILLTAVPKQVQANYLKLFSLANLDLRVVEIESLALIRAIVDSSTSNCVIIDMGAKTTSISFVSKGLLQLTRNIGIGGETITNRIAQALNISVPRAEQFKRDFGVSQATFIPEAIKPVLGSIKNQVKQLIALYKNNNIEIDTVLLVGGGANIPGLAEYMADLAPHVSFANPLQKVTVRPDLSALLENYKYHLAIAIGLALNPEG